MRHRRRRVPIGFAGRDIHMTGINAQSLASGHRIEETVGSARVGAQTESVGEVSKLSY